MTLRSGDTAWCWKIAYDEAFGRFSPGVQLLLDVTQGLLDAEAALLRAGTRAMTRAHSIEEAERYITSAPFDVAILDVNLNGRPSFPLADLLADRGISFVFASGYSSLDALPERWRGVPLVNKPYRTAELATAIAQARRHVHAQ